MRKAERFYILFGKHGQVGRRLLERVQSEIGAQVLAFDREEYDLAGSSSELRSRLNQIDGQIEKFRNTHEIVALFTAAYTHVDGCELRPEFCRHVNVTNTIEVLNHADRNWGAKIVFFSSDYVFDGRSGPYLETDVQRPLSVYGRAKKEVEDWIETHCADRLILRTTGVFDYDRSSKNFVMQVLERLERGQAVHVVRDQYATPVWAKELSDATIDLVRAGAVGVYNVAGGGPVINRVELARAVAQAFGYPTQNIVGISTASLRQPAARPKQGGLLSHKTKQLIGWSPRSAAEALRILARK